MSKELKSFLGTGWSFPPTFNKFTKSVDMVSDEVDISQSLKIILFTDLNTRIMRPDFGSGLKRFAFDTINSASLSILANSITEAIDLHEPRIDLNEVVIDESEALDGTLLINLMYTIKSVNIRTNVVFPFYLKEGTNITDM
ncbi:MAG: GPW/gp25 family protein [Flammeovirgaceae bacterium]|jgi:uncharacterized protein|nr:GPW/gp25 family protein [Flammeovirgaceae bacterium]